MARGRVRGQRAPTTMSDPAPTVTSMTDHEAGDHLARLMLPYRRREPEDADGPDHEAGWWFTDAPPDVTREALAVVDSAGAERPNDQPPGQWLVAQAERRDGMIAADCRAALPSSAFNSPRVAYEAWTLGGR